MSRFDLTRIPFVKALLRNRLPQFLFTSLALGGLIFIIASGLLGTPVGSHNFAIVFTWILWWAVLMLVAVPFVGRGWCSICPVPSLGEWLQHGAVLGRRAVENSSGFKHIFNPNKRWPVKLRNIWLQNGLFILVALFSAIVLTIPLVTAVVLIAMFLVAIIISLVYERRVFCRYICPVGGFIGLYSRLAPLELRVKDTALCSSHQQKTCYTGNQAGYGCPWLVYPGSLAVNTNCGLCLECLRTCPYDNIAINLRSFGSDLNLAGKARLDDTYKAFIMLGSAIAYAAIFLGPWGTLKLAAYQIGTLPWFIYALTFMFFMLVGLPGLFVLSVKVGQLFSGVTIPIQRGFTTFAQSLIPLGLTAWIAFSLSFIFTNFSYIWITFSDPLGWGWDLFGTAQTTWQPYLVNVLPFLEASILLLGLFWSVRTLWKLAEKHISSEKVVRFLIPLAVFCLGTSFSLLWLLVA